MKSAKWWLDLFDTVARHSVTRFCLVGLAGLTVDLVLLWVLTVTTDWPRLVCVTIAFVITYALNFTANRFFSFHAHGPVPGQVLRFVPQVTADYLLTLAGVEAFVALGLPLLAARILAGGTNAVLNYLAYRYWTFRPVAQA